ncbi:MAG: hypothetical protein KBA91_03190, partial [Candidatus Moranbacteria bacterium]|nr:hypothetical protein [Candidatus Moranbacteria bacterium]
MFSYSSVFKQYKNIKKYTTLFVFALALFFLQPASAWAAPSVSVDPPESVIYKGESKTLTWTIAGAVSCSGSYTGITSGTQTVSPFPEQVYTTTCVDGTGASASASAMVSVIPAVSLTASKTIITITQPETITLTWSSDGDSCVDNSLSSVAGTGSVDVSPSQTTTYRYTCWYNGSARNSSSSVEIKLVRSDTYCYGDGSNVTWLTNCDSPWRDTIEGGIPFGKNKVFQNYKQGYTGQVTVNCTNSGTTYNTGATCSGGGYYCSGPEPYLLSSNTAVYPGDIDTATLTSDLPWIYSATDTSRKCEWHCQAGFEYRKVSRDTWGCAPISNGGDPLPPSAVLDFSVDRNVVKLGQPIELTWSASGFPDGGGCERGSTPDSPLVGWNGRMEKAELEKDGSITFVPSDATGRNVVGDYTYSLCARSVTVRVDDPPVINVFKAEPSAIDPGQSSALSWEASGSSIAVCHLFNGSVRVNPNGGPIGTPLYITVDGKSAMTPDILIWTGGGGTGSKVVSPATTQDYTFICRNTVFKTAPGFGASYGFVSKTTRVTVNGTPDPGDGGGGGGGINPTVDTSCPSGATCKSFSTCDSSGGTAGKSCG